METSRGVILALAVAAAIILAAPPCSAGENNTKEKEAQSIFTEDERGEERTGRGRGRGRFELTEEEMNRVMESLKKRDPEKAKELADLRKTDPEQFRVKLWENAREELEKIGRERWEKWLQERRVPFLEWLEKNVPDEIRELARLQNADPNLYQKKYDLVWRKYYRIFDESRRNPDWAKVLLEDVKLQKRQDELVAKIKATKNTGEEKRLTAELEEVIGLRYDVILRRRQMAYERLLRRLEDLRSQIRESRAEIIKYQDPKTKEENVKQRTRELLEEKKRFRWD